MNSDEAAFQALIAPLVPSAYKLAVTMLRDPTEASDAVQDSMLLAWKRIDRLRDAGAARPWFLATVANRCRSVRRMRWWSVLRVPELQHNGRAFEEEAVLTIALEGALKRLGRSDRLALFLFFYLDLPLEEVSQILGLSVSASRSRIYRAVRRLRPELTVEEVLL